MSRMGNWILEMQEAATEMGLQEFVKNYGYAAAETWYEINFGDDRDREPELVEMDDGA